MAKTSVHEKLTVDGKRVSVLGDCAPGYRNVLDALIANFRERGELGASVCVYRDGRKVVDLWGGWSDRDHTRPYGPDTLQLVFSTTKGATAMCANLLAQRGELDLDAPVTRYWPEFGQAGKEDVPVRWLLTHQVGLPALDRTLTPEEVQAWDPVIEALAAQSPFWEPGTAHGYHALTYGWLVGEVIRRVTGTSVGSFFAHEFAAPLGLEFWIGLPSEQEHRVSPVFGAASALPTESGASSPSDYASTLLARTLNAAGAFSEPGWMNQPDWHAAEVPAANGITNATSLSRLYAGLIGPVEGGPDRPILTRDQLDEARIVRTFGADQVFASAGFPMEQQIGQGFWLSSPYAPFGGEGSFGHTGAGGSFGYADPENGLAVGYVMNKMSAGVQGDPRARRLTRACYASIGVEPKYS
jgi:CubicO group peptidase (beta-lactamase class C family)